MTNQAKIAIKIATKAGKEVLQRIVHQSLEFLTILGKKNSQMIV